MALVGTVEYRRIGFQRAVGANDRRVGEAHVLAEGVFGDLWVVAESRAELSGYRGDAADRGEVGVQTLPGGDQFGLPTFDDLLGGRFRVEQRSGVRDRCGVFVEVRAEAVENLVGRARFDLSVPCAEQD